MAMAAEDIETLIKAALPDAIVEMTTYTLYSLLFHH